MTSLRKKYGAAIIYGITAVAILASAYLLKGTEYENAWFYLLAVGIILAAAFEVYIRTKK